MFLFGQELPDESAMEKIMMRLGKLEDEHEERVTKLEDELEERVTKATMEKVMKKLGKLENELEERVTKLEELGKVSTLRPGSENAEDEHEERITKLEELVKVGTLRSCSEYADFGLRTDGLYMIDPDGPLVGQPPFQVFCNFTTGATEVLHDAGNLTPVDHCRGPGLLACKFIP